MNIKEIMNEIEKIANETALQIMANIVPAGPQDVANLAIIEDNILSAIRRALDLAAGLK